MTENPCAAAHSKDHIVLNGNWPKIAATVIAGLFLAMITAAGTAAYNFGQLSAQIKSMQASVADIKNDINGDHQEFRERIRQLERMK